MNLVAKEVIKEAKLEKLLELIEIGMGKEGVYTLISAKYEKDVHTGDYIYLYDMKNQKELGKIFESEDGFFTWEKRDFPIITLSEKEISVFTIALNGPVFRALIGSNYPIDIVIPNKSISKFQALLENGIMEKWLVVEEKTGLRLKATVDKNA